MTKCILSINALKAMNFLIETVFADHTVIVVKDVLRGLQELRQRQKIDFVLIDIDWNTAENLEFIDYLKSSPFYAGISLIVLGTSNIIEQFNNEIKIADQVFAKPFNPQNLSDYITKPIRLSQRQTA